MKLAQVVFETRIKVEEQGRELNYVNHKLKFTGVNDSYDIAIEVNSLYPQSRSYYNTFSSTLKNTLKACQLVGNDLTAPQTGNAVSPKVQAIKKLLFCGFCGLIADIPFVGIGLTIPFVGIGMTVLHEYVDNLWDCTVEKATTEKMKNISNIVMDKLNYPKALKITAERLALDFIKLRSEEILTINKTDEQNNSKIKNIFNLFIKNIPTIPKATLSVVGVKENDEPIIKLALLDVALITKYLYEHHERITASSLPLIEEINNTIILKESFNIQKNNIAHNPLMTLQRDLYHQVECKLSSTNIIEDIRKKAAKGQWEDVPCGYWPLNYTDSGIKTILEKDSIKNCLKLKPTEELTPKQIEDFRIFAFQEIGKSVDCSKEKHYTCIEKFKEVYSEIINKLVELKTWYFFPNKQIIEICVEDPQLKSQITKQLTDKEWHQSCFNFNPPPLQVIGSSSSNEGDLVDGFHNTIMNS